MANTLETRRFVEMLALNIFLYPQNRVELCVPVRRIVVSAEDEAETIMRFCRERMVDAHYPLDDFCPGANVVQLEAMGFSAQSDAASRVGS